MFGESMGELMWGESVLSRPRRYRAHFSYTGTLEIGATLTIDTGDDLAPDSESVSIVKDYLGVKTNERDNFSGEWLYFLPQGTVYLIWADGEGVRTVGLVVKHRDRWS
ncbi:unnamed protein product [marine sediment metagenome]|uniref:Uncharacterized protein n=1 Tax=marine sediment metagenome TaxID=412755 RepID=X0W3K8_9ZZZZ